MRITRPRCHEFTSAGGLSRDHALWLYHRCGAATGRTNSSVSELVSFKFFTAPLLTAMQALGSSVNKAIAVAYSPRLRGS